MPRPPTVLLTRPKAQSHRFAQALRDRLGDVGVIVSPLIEVRFLNAPLPEGPRIFTSENGVRAHLRLEAAEGRAAWCVGPRTAQAAFEAGFSVLAGEEPGGGDAKALVARLRREAGGAAGTTASAAPFVHVRGVHAAGAVADQLNAAGIKTREAVLYDQRACPLGAEARAALAGTAPVFAPLFSPRSARLFALEATGAHAPLHLVALSPAVADCLHGCPSVSLDTAPQPVADALLATLAHRIAMATRA